MLQGYRSGAFEAEATRASSLAALASTRGLRDDALLLLETCGGGDSVRIHKGRACARPILFRPIFLASEHACSSADLLSTRRDRRFRGPWECLFCIRRLREILACWRLCCSPVILGWSEDWSKRPCASTRDDIASTRN